MIKVKPCCRIALILLSLILSPTILFSDTIYYGLDGNFIEKSQYDHIAVDRDKIICLKLKDGYISESNGWKDPIRLRKKRIEQWKNMRSMYNPNSLPSKIETEPITKNR